MQMSAPRPGWCCEPARAVGEGGAIATAAAMQGAAPAYVPGPVEVCRIVGTLLDAGKRIHHVIMIS